MPVRLEFLFEKRILKASGKGLNEYITSLISVLMTVSTMILKSSLMKCASTLKTKIYEPFGEGIPKPVFLIRNVPLIAKYGEYVTYIGKNREHLKFVTKGYSLVGFSMAHQYVQEGKPRKIDVIGRIGINESRYGSFPQVEIIDFSSSM